MKVITIPERFGYPTVDITVNGIEHTLETGVEVEVEDNVAAVVENALALAPKYGRNISRLAQLAEGSLTDLTASDLYGITAIYNYAFYNCDRFQSVTIPNGVKSIGYSAFRLCGNLKKIEIPESILNIDERAFDMCISLARVTLKALTPPIIQSETFASIPTTCVIEVPSESVKAYKSAANWSTIASQIVAIKE